MYPCFFFDKNSIPQSAFSLSLSPIFRRLIDPYFIIYKIRTAQVSTSMQFINKSIIFFNIFEKRKRLRSRYNKKFPFLQHWRLVLSLVLKKKKKQLDSAGDNFRHSKDQRDRSKVFPTLRERGPVRLNFPGRMKNSKTLKSDSFLTTDFHSFKDRCRKVTVMKLSSQSAHRTGNRKQILALEFFNFSDIRSRSSEKKQHFKM